jgi:hypothetical protein
MNHKSIQFYKTHYCICKASPSQHFGSHHCVLAITSSLRRDGAASQTPVTNLTTILLLSHFYFISESLSIVGTNIGHRMTPTLTLLPLNWSLAITLDIITSPYLIRLSPGLTEINTHQAYYTQTLFLQGTSHWVITHTKITLGSTYLIGLDRP